jgi:hypothetical protein
MQYMYYKNTLKHNYNNHLKDKTLRIFLSIIGNNGTNVDSNINVVGF